MRAHRLVGEPLANPSAVVDWFGAVQAQDYAGALWGIGLRSNATRAEVEDAIAKGRIVRTWADARDASLRHREGRAVDDEAPRAARDQASGRASSLTRAR
ncbi:MAG TPA: crosslink repair DNA glycosylase YcaQ family protein [Polyangiaceae bacterium]